MVYRVFGIYLPPQRHNETMTIPFIDFQVTFLDMIDYIGTFAFAISGVRLSSTKKFDLFGAFVVGFVTAVGGGTIRDLFLGVTPFWMIQPSYAIITFLSLITVIVFKKWIVRLNYTFFIFDAIGLALFTVVGFEKSMNAGNPTWINIIMGCITGAAGGVIRDVLINEVPLIFRKDIYAMACIGGGFFYWLSMKMGLQTIACEIIAAIAVLMIRILCVHYGIELPSLYTDDNSGQTRIRRGGGK